MTVAELIEKMKPDERQFLFLVFQHGRTPDGALSTIREAIRAPECPVHHKRAWYLLSKWSSRKWYDWGCNIELGWLTEAGKEAARLASTHPALKPSEMPL